MRVLLLFVLANVAFVSYSQSPAGIGSGDGSVSPRNVLWLRADAGITEAAGIVSAWADQSGNSLNASQATVGLRPTYTSANANLNNQPSINFGPTGTNKHLVVADNNLLDNSAEMSFFIVMRMADASSTYGLLNKRTDTDANQAYRIYTNGTNFNTDINDGADATGSVAANTSYLISAVYDHSLTGDRNLLYLNSTFADGATVTTTLDNKASPLYIGTFDVSSGETRNFPGDIAEIILYNQALTAPQRLIVDNYLSQKYDIHISTHDIFGNMGTYSTTFFTDFRALGSVDGTTKETTATSNALIVRESNNTLDAGEFVAFAHDNTTHASNNTSQIGTGITNRWARSWYLESSFNGVVDGGAVSAELVFDFGDAGLSYTGSINDYVLLYRDDLADNFEVIYVDNYTLEAGDRVVARVPANRLQSGYYTLGRGTSSWPKPGMCFKTATGAMPPPGPSMLPRPLSTTTPAQKLQELMMQSLSARVAPSPFLALRIT
ncbi:MAG: LamG domain-containing protein [Cytophagales bacterium]|nr:LamG domain-containing protein [Cytophagales bacterium]